MKNLKKFSSVLKFKIENNSHIEKIVLKTMYL